MNLQDTIKKLKKTAKKIKWLYIPYNKIKCDMINKQKIKALQKTGLEIISDVETALNKTDLLYFANFGTLLGIVRDQNFIGWDNDIDYGIIATESFSWEKLENIMYDAGYSKIRQFTLCGDITEQTFCKGTLTVDFFLYENKEENIIGHGYFKAIDFQYESDEDFHVKEGIFPKISQTQKVAFLGIEVTIPKNAEEFLESVYTDRWRIPDPDWEEHSKNRKNIIVLSEMGHGELY